MCHFAIAPGRGGGSAIGINSSEFCRGSVYLNLFLAELTTLALRIIFLSPRPARGRASKAFKVRGRWEGGRGDARCQLPGPVTGTPGAGGCGGRERDSQSCRGGPSRRVLMRLPRIQGARRPLAFDSAVLWGRG